MTILERLMSVYPANWRRRYGDEYRQMLEDTLDGRHPGFGFALSVTWGGVVERCHAA